MTTSTYSAHRLHLWWLTLALFLSYLSVAMSLPVVSIYVTDGLKFNNLAGGLAVGIAFVSTIATRTRSGRLSDQRGGKTVMTIGLLVYTLASLLCMLAVWRALPAHAAYAVLLLGRLALGLGESLAVVGMLGWGVALSGPQQAGRFMALMGMGMYGSFAVGAPMGLALYHHWGFGGVMLASALLPLVGLAMIRCLPAIAGQPGERVSFWSLLGRIGAPGTVVGLQGVGFAAIGAFLSLYYIDRGWPSAWIGLSGFSVGFVVVRLFFGHLPDRLGGRPVALVSLLVEAAGQALLWLAPAPAWALAGAVLTGCGCSLVYPSMGAEVVRRVPPHLRATAMGGFAAFQDLAYAGTGPLAGWFADRWGYAVVFLIGAAAALAALITATSVDRQEPGRQA
ncbi:arabinose transporter [Candidimonas nitroreducens]|uniref:Uncharacterized MFS-type transporter CEY11_21875 n=1 Tax=Candidimonas nitroreducens TaxID=683354 RepID=A0A225M090_9BURK|nr:arabinose transporter [Candidimonas nitroreducens]OWT54805.1 arabinose transporter [Candidimonas nitroreducens]